MQGLGPNFGTNPRAIQGLTFVLQKDIQTYLRHRAGGPITEFVGSSGSLRDLDWALFS